MCPQMPRLSQVPKCLIAHVVEVPKYPSSLGAEIPKCPSTQVP